MTAPFPNLKDAVLVSKSALDAAVSQLPGIAQTAANAQATADAAIPKSLIGTAPGDVVALDAKGGLPAVDGSQLTGVVAHSILPALIVELGHSMLASDGRGVDRGNWYQLNLGIGTNARSTVMEAPKHGRRHLPGVLWRENHRRQYGHVSVAGPDDGRNRSGLRLPRRLSVCRAAFPRLATLKRQHGGRAWLHLV